LIDYISVNGNQVIVSTKSPRSDKQYVWEAVADSSSYVIREETDPEKILRRGTQITLHLRVSGIFSHFSNAQFVCNVRYTIISYSCVRYGSKLLFPQYHPNSYNRMISSGFELKQACNFDNFLMQTCS
jgi:hypothetical protein